MKTRLLLFVLFITGIFITASAQTDNSPNQSNQNQDQPVVEGFARGVWIDTDNDGVCDNFETYGAPGRGLGPGGGKGLASARPSAPGRGYGRGFRGGGRGYIAGNRQGLPVGQGRGFGPGNGRGLGPGRGAGLAPRGRSMQTLPARP